MEAAARAASARQEDHRSGLKTIARLRLNGPRKLITAMWRIVQARSAKAVAFVRLPHGERRFAS
jgi:hypothetical protein